MYNVATTNHRTKKKKHMLSDEQFQEGMPISGPQAGAIDVTRYLSLRATSRLVNDVTPTPSVLAPTLKWMGCLAGGNTTDKDNTSKTTVKIDLETTAAVLSGTEGILFADVTQGSVNMCTSLAFVHAYTLRYVLQGLPEPVPQLSAVYAYYYQRIQECMAFDVCRCSPFAASTLNGSLCSGSAAATGDAAASPGCLGWCDPPCMDCGSYLASAVSVFSAGVCPSALWPYTVNINSTPSDDAAAAAPLHRITSMSCVQTGAGFLARLEASFTLYAPVVVFLSLTPVQVTWMQARQDAYNTEVNGVLDVVLPDFVDQEDASAYVGHAVLAVGIQDDRILLRNNFGNAWGARGRFCILSKHASSQQFHTAVAVASVAAVTAVTS